MTPSCIPPALKGHPLAIRHPREGPGATHPAPGSPGWAELAQGQALTELALQAKVLPDLADPHHGGVPDLLQDIWQDFGGFFPTIEEFAIVQKHKTKQYQP